MKQPHHFAVILDELEDRRALRVLGTLDQSTAGEFASRITQELSRGDELLVDFSDCSRIDFSVVTALQRFHEEHAERLTLAVQPSSSIERLFRVFDLPANAPR